MKSVIKCPKNEFIIECCKCHKVRTKDGWEHKVKDHKKPVSHTYCDSCFQVACGQIERIVSNN
ncbi:MAG: hypothetical protein COA79_14950 [Planctomycetota bacterium]|nr:MAG: hypothetical protein COA79_14950 [Planctomycetota bacterium]